MTWFNIFILFFLQVNFKGLQMEIKLTEKMGNIYQPYLHRLTPLLNK